MTDRSEAPRDSADAPSNAPDAQNAFEASQSDEAARDAYAPRNPVRRMGIFLALGVGLGVGIVNALLVSAAFQVGAVVYLTQFVEVPPPLPLSERLANRFVQILVEEQRQDEPTPPEQPEPEPEPEPFIVADPAPAEEAEPEPEPEPAPEPEPPAEERPAQASDNGTGDGGGVDAVGIGGGDGGTAPAVRTGTPGGRRGGGGGERPAPSERRAERREDAERSEADRARVARLEDTSKPPCEQRRQEPAVPYPQDLRAAAVHGTVQIQCIVTETGHLRGCRHRGGPEELFRVALPAVQQWRCSPAETSDGERIAAPYNFRIPFRLEA